MRRRRTPALLAAALLTMTLAGCSADDGARWRDDGGPAVPAASAPGQAAPPARSSVPAGSAPAEPFAVGVRELKLTRDADRALPVTIWYPATGSAGGTPRRGRPAA